MKLTDLASLQTHAPHARDGYDAADASNARRFTLADHEVVEQLDFYRSWFEHVAEPLRAAATEFDPQRGRALLDQLERLDVGYASGSPPRELRYRDAAAERAAIQLLNAMVDYVAASFAAVKVALANDAENRVLWLLAGVPHPFPHREVAAAERHYERVNFLDLHDHDHLSRETLFAIGELEQLVVLDLAATSLTTKRVDEIAFGALPNLRAIDLAENQLTSIPDAVWRARALEYLAIRNNRITTLPPALLQNETLRCIDLRRTAIPAEEIAALRRARPALHVLTDPASPGANL